MRQSTFKKTLMIHFVCLLVVASFVPSSFAAVITVNSTADNLTAGDGLCTLREALRNANFDSENTSGDCVQGAGNDVITLVAGATYKLTLVGVGDEVGLTGDLDIIERVNIETDTPGVTATIEGSGDRVFDIKGSVDQPAFDDLIIANGFANNGIGDDNGGGIRVGPDADLTLRTSVVRNNRADANGGGIACDDCDRVLVLDSIFSGNEADADNNGGGIGGGIFLNSPHDVDLDESIIGGIDSSDGNSAVNGGGVAINQDIGFLVQITRTAIINNEASNNGGGLYDFKTPGAVVRVANATISGNSAGNDGGGVYKADTAVGTTLLISHTTITNNTADSDANGNGDGGGISTVVASSTTLVNSIVAGNVGPSRSPDCDDDDGAGNFADNTSLIGMNDGCSSEIDAGFPNSNAAFVGTSDNPIDPGLNQLAFNAPGSTPTHLLKGDSLAIDKGRVLTCQNDAQFIDQRDVTRPIAFKGGANLCDLGAVELQFFERFDEEQSIRVSQAYEIPFHCGERRVDLTNGGDDSIKIEHFETLITVLYEETRISTSPSARDQAQNVLNFTLNNPSVFGTPGTMSINVMATQNPGKSYLIDCNDLKLYPITLDDDGEIATTLIDELSSSTEFFQGNLTIQSSKTLRILVKKIKRTWLAVPDGGGSTFTNGKHELIEEEITGQRASGSQTVSFFTSAPSLPVSSARASSNLDSLAKPNLKFGHASRVGAKQVIFKAQGVGSTSIEVNIFSLRGQRIAHRSEHGNQLRWNMLTDLSRVVANGVYLYQITIRDSLGNVIRSEIRKLLVLR